VPDFSSGNRKAVLRPIRIMNDKGRYLSRTGMRAALYNEAMTPATSSLDMNVILAAGGVLCRQTPAGGDEVLVVRKNQ
jgi:hypothetical protein